MLIVVNKDPKKFKHIIVEYSIYESLKKCGCAGESFNDVINRLLKDCVKMCHRSNESKAKVEVK
jgi:predicted CopG family antitoxin